MALDVLCYAFENLGFSFFLPPAPSTSYRHLLLRSPDNIFGLFPFFPKSFVALSSSVFLPLPTRSPNPCEFGSFFSASFDPIALQPLARLGLRLRFFSLELHLHAEEV